MRDRKNLRHLQSPQSEDDEEIISEIPDELFEAAQEYLEDNFLLRYLSKKYSIPPNDSRLQAYTHEEMIVEFVADAIEDDRLDVGAEGKPIKKVLYKGVEITKTGSPVFDQLEREWAEQEVGQEIPDAPGEREDEGVDLFGKIQERVSNAVTK